MPGTTDEAGVSHTTTGFELGHLTRTHRFEGYAWYQRDIDIPSAWRGKRITLFLERAHWATTVWLEVSSSTRGRIRSRRAPNWTPGSWSDCSPSALTKVPDS